ncbi:MAG: hypothetical protein JWN34_3561 [Bryobacterales bacterium]|jgi:hypothetical protein|nr:hypothetical protein [Bryobacterales bacterium]
MKSLLLASALLLGSLTMACAQPRYGGYVGGGYYGGNYGGYYAPPPPPPRVYARVPAPGPGFFWVDGYWNFLNSRYVWVDGYWGRPPYRGSYWVAPRYYGRRYYPGYWGRRR